MRIGLNASQFSFLITMKSQVSKVLGHKEVSLDLQDILTHAEVLCWLWPKLGTAPRPAGTHNHDSTTCTNIHEVRAKLKRAEQCKRRKRLCGSSELCFTASAAYTRHVTVISIDWWELGGVLQVGLPLETLNLISVYTSKALYACNSCMKRSYIWSNCTIQLVFYLRLMCQ